MYIYNYNLYIIFLPCLDTMYIASRPYLVDPFNCYLYTRVSPPPLSLPLPTTCLHTQCICANSTPYAYGHQSRILTINFIYCLDHSL